jgi:hypothetical protein
MVTVSYRTEESRGLVANDLANRSTGRRGLSNPVTWLLGKSVNLGDACLAKLHRDRSLSRQVRQMRDFLDVWSRS